MWPHQIHGEHQNQAEGNFPQVGKIPGWLVEKLHNQKVMGGYGKRNKLCGVCHTMASNTGECLC